MTEKTLKEKILKRQSIAIFDEVVLWSDVEETIKLVKEDIARNYMVLRGKDKIEVSELVQKIIEERFGK
jgi:hypothetical protein